MKRDILTPVIVFMGILAVILFLWAVVANGQSSKTPIKNGILQSDLDAAGYKINRANMVDYAGLNMTWNPTTNRFDAAAGGGGGGAVSSVFTRTGAVVALVGDYSAFYQPLDADLTTWATLTPSANFQTMVPHTFAQMRSDLGLVIGTNVQAWDTDLDVWATKTPYAGSVVVTTGKTFTDTNNLTLSGTDGSTLNIGSGGTLGTAAYTASSAYQAADSDLTAWAAKTTYAGDLTITTGKTLNATNTLTLSGTDSSTLNIGTGGTLGTAAFTASTAYLPIGGGTLTGKLTTLASATGGAGFNLPTGAAPTSPSQGDLWLVATQLFYRGTASTFTTAALQANQSYTGTNNFTGAKTGFFTPTTAGASINLPHGVAPSAPVNGDVWTTTTGLYTQINSATVGPFRSRVTRVTSIVSNATWSPSADTDDQYEITAQAAAVTTISNPTGTPVDGQNLIIRFKDDGTARALTWSGSQWEAGPGMALPTTTVVGNHDYVGFKWNSTTSKWTMVASTQLSGIDDTAYASTWNAVTGTAPSKNAVYDELHKIDTADDGTIVNAGTGFRIAGAASNNYELTGNGTNFLAKASDIPNGSSAQQTGFSSPTYLAGSVITINAGDFKVGSTYRCMFDMAKTTAGTAGPVITIYIGTAGTTSDTAAQTITFAAATGVADTGMFEVWVNFRAVGASATISSVGRCVHNLAATGLTSTGASGSGTVSNSTSSTFNSTAATKIGVAFNGGTSYVGTNNIVQAYYSNP